MITVAQNELERAEYFPRRMYTDHTKAHAAHAGPQYSLNETNSSVDIFAILYFKTKLRTPNAPIPYVASATLLDGRTSP